MKGSMEGEECTNKNENKDKEEKRVKEKRRTT
jgi:hypothetical protein